MDRNVRYAIRSAAMLMLLPCSGLPLSADCDTAAPQLVQFYFSPSSLNVTAGSQFVTCEISASDDLAGVEEATCTFRSGTFLQSQSCTATEPSFGERLLGTFRCNVVLPRHAEAGTWRAQVTIKDRAGNRTHLTDGTLLQQGRPVHLGVTSESDFYPPVLTAFDFGPRTVQVTGAAAAVLCSMTLEDALSGVASATCSLGATDTFQVQSCTANAPATGTANSGTFQCTVSIPRYSDHGTWRASVTAKDRAGNVFFADPATLELRGLPVNLAVVSAAEDVKAPVLVDFDFQPRAVDASSATALVGCSATISDTPAGVDKLTCAFRAPGQEQPRTCATTLPTSGTPTSGTYACAVALPRFSPGGAWSAAIAVTDKVGNALTYEAEDLQSRGFPSELIATCSGPAEFVPVVRFVPGSRDSIVWDRIPGALRYNVYRGTLSELRDRNGDGTPDDGYGTCMNGLDPDLTDTWFFDPQLPSAVEGGYYYLVTYRDGSDEKGLGRRSNGQLRSLSWPCP